MVKCWGLKAFLVACALLMTSSLSAVEIGQDVWLEGEIEPGQVPVQTQAIYRLRFFQGVDVQDLSFAPPSAPLADFRPIGDGRVFETVRNGRRYRVHERSYGVFPFASGKLQISGHAEGRVIAAGVKSSDGRRVLSLSAVPVTLSVLPLPAGATLAAKSVTLTETWLDASAEPTRVGARLKRRIHLEVLGVDAGQLPEIQLDVPGMTVHPEAAKLENRWQGQWNVASRDQIFNLIPAKSGEIEVPEVRLAWWDGKGVESATLPARQLQVEGGPVIKETVTVAPAKSELDMPWAISIMAFPMAFLGLMAWGRRDRIGAAWRLRQACRRGDIKQVRDGLLAWAAGKFPDAPPRTLVALANRLADPQAKEALFQWERSLYGPPSVSGGHPNLAQAVRTIKRQIRRLV